MQTFNKSKNIQELVRLVQENPDLEIMVMADSELLCGDFNWMRGDINKVEIDEYCERDEYIYLWSKDEDLVIEEIMEDIYHARGYKEGDITEEGLRKEAEKQPNWKKAICVRVGP